MMRRDALVRRADGIWYRGHVPIRVELPGELARQARLGDVEVHLSICAPGHDRELVPVVEFDFGRQDAPSLRFGVNPAVFGEGVRLVLPRGSRALFVRPHIGAFFARDLSISVQPAGLGCDGRSVCAFHARAGREDGRSDLVAASENDIAAHGMTFDPNGAFRTLNHDPHAYFALPRPLQPGWWRISVRMESDRPVSPRVYLPRAGAWTEEESATLFPAGGGHYCGYVHLVDEVESVRFDPCDLSGVSGALGMVRLEPCHNPGLDLLRPRVLRATREQRQARRLWRALRAGQTMERHFALPVSMPASTEPVLSLHKTGAEYERWIERFDVHPTRKEYGEAIGRLGELPLISIVMPAYKTPIDLLDQAIESVRSQFYTNWQLCIAEDASDDAALRRRLELWQQRDSRIQVVFREQNGGISAATQSAFELADGEWIALLDHDDVLRPQALAEIVLAIGRSPGAELIYSDEDKIDIQGRRYDPFFKPDFSYHLLLSQNYFNHLTVHRADNIRAVGGWRSAFDGSQDYDLNLRIVDHVDGRNIVHLPKILYHWRSIPGSAAAGAGEKSYTFEAGRRALLEHLDRRGDQGTIGQAGQSPYYRVRFDLPAPAPRVSLIIPTRDRADLVQLSVGSILEKTDYPDFEILLVDNQSSDPKALRLFKELEQDDRVRVLRYDRPFNYSAINNFAAREATGSILGLVNNDIEIIHDDWLSEMASLAARPTVGCVGAKLYFPDERIQHGGVVLGIGDVAGHSHKYLPRDTFGYFGRMTVTHEVSAVTAACLLVRRAVFEEVGGLNETDLRVAFNDVDFCLRVREAGYSNLFTPFAELYHHESVSRGQEDSPEKRARFQTEAEYMMKRWQTNTKPDAFYSIHLSRTHEDFRLREEGA